MVKCEVCGVEVYLPFKCAYCEKYYCINHRLPENHFCSKLALIKTEKTWLYKSRKETIHKSRPFSLLALIQEIKKKEFNQLVIAWFVLSFCFSIEALFKSSFLSKFLISLITVGLGFMMHEVAHRNVAKFYGCIAEFKLWPLGLIMALILALISGGKIIFAAPGAVYITPKYFTLISKDKYGKIALSGPLTNIIIALIFLLLTIFYESLRSIGWIGFKINMWLAAFNLLPFGVMDGKKVFEWNSIIWALITVPTWLLLFYPF
ncbi:MAG: AN1-type zinc finger domain-containing protein [Candidatus Bathyarchaeia archaeon]|nr:hypothetical protein [Candidatus Bathyarchaeota archaeon]